MKWFTEFFCFRCGDKREINNDCLETGLVIRCLNCGFTIGVFNNETEEEDDNV